MFSLVSSVGANQHSWFLYPRTKGETEQMVLGTGFSITSIIRPGLLDREGATRTVEKLAGRVCCLNSI